MRLDGSGRRPLGFRADFLARGPDGTLLFLDGTHLGVVGQDGRGLRVLGRYPQWSDIPWAAWSPDGRSIAVNRGVGCDVVCTRVETWIVDVGRGTARRVAHDCGEARWSPDGTRLVCERYAHAWSHDNPHRFELLSLSPHRWLAIGSSPAWLTDDSILYVGHGPTVMRADGTHRVAFRNGALPLLGFFVLSPARTAIAVCCTLNHWTREGVFVLPLRRGRAHPLDRVPTDTDVYDSGQYSQLTWSPDGRLVAWTRAQQTGYDQVLVAPADGSRKPVAVTHGAGYVSGLTFSADGTRLLYALG